METMRPASPDNARIAVVVIVFTVFALALGDALIKGVSANFTLWQIFLLRSAVVLPVLVCVVKLCDGGVSFWPRHAFWTVLRSLMLTFMWVAYYAALPHIDLSIAAAAYYTLPLFITIFAAAFLGDTIGRLGWVAIGTGFVGVLLILEPQAKDFNWYALLPVSSAILYALAMILTRSRCQSESVFVLSLWLNLSMFVVGTIATLVVAAADLSSQTIARQEFLFGAWSPMGAKEWGATGLLATAILIASVGAAYAYQNGPPATIATFDFAYVAFAVTWGLIIFHEIPSVKGVIGILLIVVAGILAIRRPGESDAAELNAVADTTPVSRLDRS